MTGVTSPGRTRAFRLMRANTFAVVAAIGLEMLYSDLDGPVGTGVLRAFAVGWLCFGLVALAAALLARREPALDADYSRLANVGPGMVLLVAGLFSFAEPMYLGAVVAALATILLNWSTARAVRRGGAP